LAGALVAAAALAAAVPLLYAASQHDAAPGLAASPSATSTGEAPRPLVSTAECGTSKAAADLTVEDVQTMLKCDVDALAAPDLVMSAETLADVERGHAPWDRRLTGPVAGGVLLVNVDSHAYAVDDEQISTDDEDWDSLFLPKDGVTLGTTLRHDSRTYQVFEPEIDELDPDGDGSMFSLIYYWQTVQSLVDAGADADPGALSLLGVDRQDDRDVVKVELVGAVGYFSSWIGVANSVELWLYVDDGLPARLDLSYDLADLEASNLPLAPAPGWCQEDSAAAGAPTICVDAPILFRWYNTDDPARDITLDIPDGYTEYIPEEEPTIYESGAVTLEDDSAMSNYEEGYVLVIEGPERKLVRFLQDGVVVPAPDGIGEVIVHEDGAITIHDKDGADFQLPEGMEAVLREIDDTVVGPSS
jgi:hypothetical protein